MQFGPPTTILTGNGGKFDNYKFRKNRACRCCKVHASKLRSVDDVSNASNENTDEKTALECEQNDIPTMEAVKQCDCTPIDSVSCDKLPVESVSVPSIQSKDNGALAEATCQASMGVRYNNSD